MGEGSFKGEVPKFPMHGLHHAKSIQNVCIGVALSITSAILLKIFYAKPRRDAYADFYSYYDPIEAFERMREAGYMQSCPPASKNDSCDKKKK